MIKDILHYMDANDEDLRDFAQRFQVLLRESLILKKDVHHSIDLLSLRHIVHTRANFNNADSLKLHLSSTFEDLEVLEHFEAGRLVIHNEDGKKLLLLQKDIRDIAGELVSKLTNHSARSEVKPVRERLEDSQAKRNTHLNALSKALSDKVACESIGHGMGVIVGLPTLLFGFFDNEHQRNEYLAWRDTLSQKKIAKLQKSLKRTPIPIIGKRSRNEMQLMFVEDDFAPVFRVEISDSVESYVPYQALTKIYKSLYEKWQKAHFKYEGKLFYEGNGIIGLTLFRRKLNVLPSFLTPRQMLHNLVDHIIQSSNCSG